MTVPKTATGIAAALRAGHTTAAAVVEAALADIAARDAGLNSFTAVTATRARVEAAGVDAALAAGQDPGPLAGVPIAVKNLFDIAGLATRAGSKILRDNPPATADAFAVAQCRKAGAIVIGATTMDEFAFGFTTENSHDGAARNPHDRNRIAGGSSGGSAAAVAAGLAPLGLGTDTNGSIRVPAGLCGLWGLKPTYGRLSRRGAHLFVGSFDHIGPLAADLDDLALAYEVLQGEDPADPVQRWHGLAPVTASIAVGIEGLRIAVATGHFARGARPEAFDAVELVARALGATARVEPRLAAEGRAAALLITMAEGANLHLADLRTRADDFDPLIRDRLLAGALLPAQWVAQAQRVRAAWRASAATIFAECDLLITPLLPATAHPIGTETIELDGVTLPARPNLGLFTQPISCIGLPALAVPLADPALVGAGMPIGVQLVAPPWREDILFRAAGALRRAGIAGCPTPKDCA